MRNTSRSDRESEPARTEARDRGLSGSIVAMARLEGGESGLSRDQGLSRFLGLPPKGIAATAPR